MRSFLMTLSLAAVLAWAALSCHPAPKASSSPKTLFPVPTEELRMGSEDLSILVDIYHRNESGIWSSDSRNDSLMLYFLGRPYVGHTLESADCHEYMVVNLHQLDCMTFTEAVLSLSVWLKECDAGRLGLEEALSLYPSVLQSIRYRGGERTDYTSRLHYASEWLTDNACYIEDITREICPEAERLPLDISYMSSHPMSYFYLGQHPEAVPVMQEIEKEINRAELYYIPEEKISSCWERIPQGAILTVVCSIAGLDYSHWAFAHFVDGELRILHASSDAGKVVISERTLESYLSVIPRFIGVTVSRIR